LLGCAAAAAAAAACPVAKCQQTKIDLVFLSSAPFALIAHRRVFHMLNKNFWTRAFYIIIRRFLFCFVFFLSRLLPRHTRYAGSAHPAKNTLLKIVWIPSISL
jgi:hypothetical protein